MTSLIRNHRVFSSLGHERVKRNKQKTRSAPFKPPHLAIRKKKRELRKEEEIEKHNTRLYAHTTHKTITQSNAQQAEIRWLEGGKKQQRKLPKCVCEYVTHSLALRLPFPIALLSLCKGTKTKTCDHAREGDNGGEVGIAQLSDTR